MDSHVKEVVDSYLAACKSHKEQPTRKTEEKMAACFFSLPTNEQGAALALAKARGFVS